MIYNKLFGMCLSVIFFSPLVQIVGFWEGCDFLYFFVDTVLLGFKNVKLYLYPNCGTS